MKKKVYLSGPSHLLRNGKEIYEKMYKLCEDYGFEVLRQPEELFNPKSSYEEGLLLARKRGELIKQCDLIIADCNDMYGSVEPYGETAFELGFAYGLEKKLYCYIADKSYCEVRFKGEKSMGPNGRLIDKDGITFEPQTLNVMLDNPSTIVEGGLEEALKQARKDFE